MICKDCKVTSGAPTSWALTHVCRQNASGLAEDSYRDLFFVVDSDMMMVATVKSVMANHSCYCKHVGIIYYAPSIEAFKTSPFCSLWHSSDWSVYKFES